MMHCHVCDDDIPLPEIVNHVRLFHPDAYPISPEIQVDVGGHVARDPQVMESTLRAILRRRQGGTW